jgi:hypothetical protein
MEIKWTDSDPEPGERRWVRAERFGKEWRFSYRSKRRSVWESGPPPTRAMWEHILDVLERRYRLRHGVTDEDIAEVKRVLARMPKPDADEEE